MLCLLKIYVKINLAKEVFKTSPRLPKFKQLFLYYPVTVDLTP